VLKRITDQPAFIAVPLVALVFAYGMLVRPRTGHATVQSAHHVDSGLVLSVEKLGAGARSIVPRTERLRLIDPLTGQQKAFTLCDDFAEYLGQSGQLWFFDSTTRVLSAYDAQTLAPLAVPAQVPKLKSATFDEQTRLLWLTASDGFTWTLDGRTGTLTKSDQSSPPNYPSPRQRWKFTSGMPRDAMLKPDGTKSQATFIRPHVVGELDDGPLVTSRDSLESNSNMDVARLAEDGAARWTVKLEGQDRAYLWWATKDALILVTRGEYGTSDWLHTLSLADGKILAQYEY
jgi:hypothetical protein